MESAAQATRQVGGRLHVAVVQLTGVVLAAGVTYEYDVEMTPEGRAAQGLADQKWGWGDFLLQGRVPLGYGPGRYPSFSLAPDLVTSRILHGSCRKPHGGGPDALVIADVLINDVLRLGVVDNFANARPHLLLLTGDQIYADDVAASLLVSLRAAATDLMGEAEELFPPGLAWDNADVQPGKGRMAFLTSAKKEEKGITSNSYDNHLMYLGEFYAMYLFCWSDALWPTFLGDRTKYLDALSLYPDPIPDAIKERVNEAKTAEKKALTEVVQFWRDVPRVRRALANVPTLMVFDDHEVTDDWNLDNLWNDNAAAPVINRIVRNGLAAFAVFQAWGNSPDRFGSGRGRDVLDALSVPATNPSAMPPVLSDPRALDTLLDLPNRRASTAERVLWDWTFDGPGYRIIALDARTHRDLANEHTGLLTREEIARQLAAHRPAPASNTLCLVIAPTPVFGHPLMEEFAQPLLGSRVGGPEMRRLVDCEAWTAKRECFETLLRTLAEFRRVVILSGDVHYGFTNHTAYRATTSGSTSVDLRARIVQLCASALKNSDSQVQMLQKVGYMGFEVLGRSWFGTERSMESLEREKLRYNKFSPTPRHPWHSHVLEDLFDKFKIGKMARLLLRNASSNFADGLMVDVYWDLTIDRTEQQPLTLPSEPWFTQNVLDLVAAIYANDPGTWKYKTWFAKDERPFGERQRVLQGPAYSPPYEYRGDALTSHKQIIAQAHSVVGYPNLGEVNVGVDAATGVPSALEHRLHWWLPNRDMVTTVHSAPLTIPTDGANVPRWDQVPVMGL